MNESAVPPNAVPASVAPAPVASAGQPATSGPWTDSPWFWMAAFAYVGLVWLAAFGPKYALRQEMVERRFEARRDVARRQASGELQVNAGPEAAPPMIDDDTTTSADVEPPPHELLVPLEPLVFLLALVLEGALAKLFMPYFAGGGARRPAELHRAIAAGSSVELKEFP